MKIRGVDPRDIEWFENHPVFRVYFHWTEQSPPRDPLGAAVIIEDEYEIREADIDRVLDWAHRKTKRNRYDTTFVVYALFPVDGDRPVDDENPDGYTPSAGDIRIYGHDPTSSEF